MAWSQTPSTMTLACVTATYASPGVPAARMSSPRFMTIRPKQPGPIVAPCTLWMVHILLICSGIMRFVQHFLSHLDNKAGYWHPGSMTMYPRGPVYLEIDDDVRDFLSTSVGSILSSAED